MKNYLFRISYDGTDFLGFQKQARGRTVAGELRNCFGNLFGEYKSFTGCSRTDSGVHANDYAFSVKLETGIPEDNLVDILNNNLSDDIRVNSCTVVPDSFNARYVVVKKEYVYNIHTEHQISPFLLRYCMQYGSDLDIDKLNRIAGLFVGKQDFKAFQASGSEKISTVRTVYECYFEYDDSNRVFVLHILGDGFLYKMVRLIVGAILNCHDGKISEDDIKMMLDTGKPVKPYAVQGKGLFLNKVYYD